MVRRFSPRALACLPWLVTLVAAMLAAPGANASTRHRSRCLPHGAETIALDRSVRVYSIPEYIEGVRTKREGIYACLFRPGTTLALEPAHRRFPRHVDLTVLAKLACRLASERTLAAAA